MKSELIDLDVHLIAETEKAILVNLDENEKDDGVWIPKSQIEINKRQKITVNITMPEWLAIKKGLV